jgi:PleD family two-component response regulator
LQFAALYLMSCKMTEPLALIFYEKLLPGQQLVNRLQDLGYRVHAVTDVNSLEAEVQKQKPMLLIAEFPADATAMPTIITALKENTATAHIPVLAYVAEANPVLREVARSAGANLVASEAHVLDQLPQLLEQVLRLD